MSQQPHGIDKIKSDATMCMVVGCDRKALYRSPFPGTKRGYCAAHKDLAVVRTRNYQVSEEAWFDKKGRPE